MFLCDLSVDFKFSLRLRQQSKDLLTAHAVYVDEDGLNYDSSCKLVKKKKSLIVVVFFPFRQAGHFSLVFFSTVVQSYDYETVNYCLLRCPKGAICVIYSV